MSEDVELISSEFDILVKKPTQSAILDSHVVRFKPIATVGQKDLEFLVPGDNETYIDLNFKLFAKACYSAPTAKLSTPQITPRGQTIFSILSSVSVA